jgi:hypothetical protein
VTYFVVINGSQYATTPLFWQAWAAAHDARLVVTSG